MYKIRKVIYEPLEIDPSELITISEAANLLDMSLPGVIRAIERGAVSEVIDTEAHYKWRRLVIRKEIEQFRKERSA